MENMIIFIFLHGIKFRMIFINQFFPEHRNVHCFPDIVTTEIGNYDFNNNERNGILLCVRNDVEKLYSFQEIKHSKKNYKK